MKTTGRAIRKKELAKSYNISLTTLASWLNRIIPELEKTGYQKSQRIFTPKQVSIIFSHFDPPEGDI